VNRDAQAVRGSHRLSHRDGSHLESRDVQVRDLDQLVGSLKGIEHGSQSEIEDTVESEDVDTHDKNDINVGVLVYSDRGEETGRALAADRYR